MYRCLSLCTKCLSLSLEHPVGHDMGLSFSASDITPPCTMDNKCSAGCRRMPLWFLWFFTIPMRAHLEHQSASTCYRIYRIYRWHWAPRHEDTLSLHALATPPRPSGSTQLRTGHRSPNQTAKRCETAKSLGHLPLPGSGQTFRKEIDRLGCSGTGFDTSGL